MKRLIAIAILGISFNPLAAQAAVISFAFEIGLPFCTGSLCGLYDDPPFGVIVVDIDLADPLTDQTWTATGHENIQFAAPFPTLIDTLGIHDASGTYEYDPISGLGTATLAEYDIVGSFFLPILEPTINSWFISDFLWNFQIFDDGFISHANYIPDTPGVATRQVGPPVPIPAAMWLFGSALAGMVFTRRRKSA